MHSLHLVAHLPSIRRLRISTSTLPLVLGLALFAGQAHAGKLSRASEAARSSSSSSSSGSSSGSGGDGSCCQSSSSSGDELAGIVLFYAISSPWLVPHLIVEAGRPEGAAGRAGFAEYPYAHGAEGLLIERPLARLAPPPNEEGALDATPPDVPLALAPVGPRKPVAAELGLEGGIGTDDGVVRSGFHAQMLFPYRLGLDTSWLLYREAHGEGVDMLGRGREHLNLRFAESSHVQFHTGIGMQHLVDSLGWVHGMDVTWGFQAFPASPVVIAAEGSLGNLGNAFAPAVRGELGVMLNRVEISAGFEERWVGPVALGGPFVSVTAWL